MIYGIDRIFTADQVGIIDSERLDEAQVAVALAPVRCIDCQEYFPLGWVAMTTAPLCSKNIGASGVQYGHRVENSVIASVTDQVANRYAKQA